MTVRRASNGKLGVVYSSSSGRLASDSCMNLIAAWLRRRLGRPVTLPDRLEEDGLLVLGGRMSVVDDGKYSWLADIRRLLCHAVDLPRPALGICLGGQLLAQTFGGTVTPGDRGLEAGIVRIRWRPEAQADALFANLPMPFLAGAMHDDMVKTLPEIAVWLGHSDMYPHHAFRVGPYAWGVQFHPEVSLAGYGDWVAARGWTDPVALRRMRRGAADFRRLDDDVIAASRCLPGGSLIWSAPCPSATTTDRGRCRGDKAMIGDLADDNPVVRARRADRLGVQLR